MLRESKLALLVAVAQLYLVRLMSFRGAFFLLSLFLASCAAPAASEQRALARPGDPVLDGNDSLLSERDFRALLSVVRAEIARNEPWLSIRRVHVVSSNKVQVRARDVRGPADEFQGEENYGFDVQRSQNGWQITRSYPIRVLAL